MHSKFFKIILVGSLLINSGCATIFHGSTDSIEIKVDKPAAKVFINEVPIGITSPDQSLKAEIPKRGNVIISIEHESCKTEEYKINRTIDPVTFLGLLIDGGIFSILVVDILGTNAFVKADQTYFEFELDCR